MNNDLVKALNEVGFVCLAFKGTSMNPLFVEGRDKVCLYAFKPNSAVKKGDIVLYKRDNGEHVLHRVMAKKGDKLKLSGDNQCMIEVGVDLSQILAICKGYYKYDKYIDFEKSIKYKFYKNTYGKFIIFRKFRSLFKRIFK